MPAKRDDGSSVLRCTKCGYEVELRGSGYRIATATRSADRVQTTSVVSESDKKLSRKKEEIEQEREEYYKELFLELLSEEEYGGEET